MYKLCISRPFLNPDFNISTDNQHLYSTLCTAYRPFIKNYNDVDTQDVREITFYSTKSGSILTLDNETKKIPSDYGLQAIENYIYLTTTVEKSALAIHGAVVAKGSNAFILAGFTRAGKSTLTAYLCSKGFEYLSDDLAIIRKKDLTLISYPRPLQLRQGGAKVLKEYGISPGFCDIIKYGDMERIVIHPTPPKLDSYHIKAIYFINRTEDKNSITVMDKNKAYVSLLKNQYVYKKLDKDLIKAVHVLMEKGVYSLDYWDMEYVYEMLEKDKQYE